MQLQKQMTNELDTSIPSNIYGVDLAKLSKLVKCSEHDLLRGMKTSSAMDMEGVYVDRHQNVAFEALDGPVHGGLQVKQVVLTATARPSVLDTFDLPKCLIELGGKTIISHIISHLYASGIEKIVIIVAYSGNMIMDAVLSHPIYSKMDIQFMNLGHDNRDGHARSILAAKDALVGPFLLHMGDHIFDDEIITEMANIDTSVDGASWALVERNDEYLSKHAMPGTTVRVKVDHAQVIEIGRKVENCNGVDAGLFLCQQDLFKVLEDLSGERPYFSLADALHKIAMEGKLKCLETKDRTWYSIETQEQLSYAIDQKGDKVLTPWAVYVAKGMEPPKRTMAASAPPERTFMFGLPNNENDPSLYVHTDEQILEQDVCTGFVVGVEHVLSTSVFQQSERKGLLDNELFGDNTPGSPFTKCITPPVEMYNEEDPYVVSIPVEGDMNEEDVHGAYLIEMKENQQLYLAVPEMPEEEEKHFLVDSLNLPSDVTGVTLETVGPAFDVQLVVERQVPIIGYILLVSSLFTISSVGAAMDLQSGIDSVLKIFWRMSATSISFFLTSIYIVRRKGLPQFSKQTWIDMLLCGISYAYFVGTFIVALELTSVGNAYIFSNSHSLIIVFRNLLIGNPVALMEGFGAVFGLFGGVICTMDSSDGASNGTNPVRGDLLALSGAVAGVAYLTFAKKLRNDIDLFVFMFLLTFVGSICIYIYMAVSAVPFEFSLHPYHGILGWLHYSRLDRLALEFYLVFICNFIGTMGYVGVMKYFEPIVVSVVMLLEPVIAALCAVLVGVAGFPGKYTIIGGLIVMFGTCLVIVSSQRKTEAINVTDTVRTSKFANRGRNGTIQRTFSTPYGSV